MKEIAAYRIAVLLTCYNRKTKTLAFLDSLLCQYALKALQVDVYLLDDGSTDGTSAAVAQKYPAVKIVAGTGSLFWAGGMRAIWQHAMAQNTYDLFWLFNDDVVLFDDAIDNLLKCYIKL